MSSVDTVPPWEFTQEGSFDAPFTVKIPASLEVQPYTATATFDGTGAGGNFVPTITIIGKGGEKLARVQPQVTVLAGTVKSCTWLPPFGSAASSAAGTGIQYDTVNEGDWLYVGATGQGGPGSPTSIWLDSQNTSGGIEITQDGGSGDIGVFNSGTGDIDIAASGGGAVNLEQSGDGGLNILQSGTGGTDIANSSGPFQVYHYGGDGNDMVFLLGAGGNNMVMQLVHTGGVFTVALDTGQKLFQIDQDGALHGKTGQSLTFDL